MIAPIYKFRDYIFRLGLEKGDLIWFLNDVVSSITTNGFFFSAVLLCLAYCSVEITGDLYVLTQKPSLDQILIFAPMFFTSVHVVTCCLPLISQRYDYIKIYKRYLDLGPLKHTDKEGILEIRDAFNKVFVATLISVVDVIIIVVSLIPFHENIEQTTWPVIAALKLTPTSDVAKYAVIYLNFVVIIIKSLVLTIYILHVVQLCVLYQVQSIVMRRKLNNIKCYKQKVADLELVDDKRYQTWIACELKNCVIEDIKLKRFVDLIITYFKWSMVFQLGNGILLLTVLCYIIVGQDTVPCPMGYKVFLFACIFTACLYVFYSEIIYEQVEKVLVTLFDIPWRTFNKSNRVMVYIFAINLTKPRFISGAGIIDINCAILVWVAHKVFSFLTVLLQMTSNSDN